MPPVVCLDLDGVVWRGDEPIPGSAEAVRDLRDAGCLVGFLSNNSSMPVSDVATKLGRLGVEVAPEHVLTSALAAADLLREDLAPGSRVLTCAGPGVTEALVAVGLEPVQEAPADAVIVGLHRDFDFDGLDRAAAAVRAGARFVATNLDATYPVAAGRLIPGAGAIVAAVATAADRTPEIAGKPSVPAAAMVRRRLGDRGVVVGDRPSTDGALATLLGWPFALVLSGVARREPDPGEEAIPAPPPPFVGDDLLALVPHLVAALVSA